MIANRRTRSKNSKNVVPAGPLSEIRVVDLSRVLSGPFASMQLGDLGADVWKIEPMDGDPSRDLAPPVIDGESAYFQSVNRNKRSLRLNFRHPDASAILFRLASQADVVIENFLPKVKTTLGIGYDEVSSINPGVVYCSISGFGQSGPYAERPGLDNIFQGMAGLMAVTGLDDRPVKCGERVGDMVAGLNAALAIVTALHARSRQGGRGQHIKLALVDCLIALQAPQISNFLATGEQTPKVGNGSYFSAPTETFLAQDRPINICVMTDKHWRSMCLALELGDLLEDLRFRSNAERVRNRDHLHGLLREVFKTRVADEWLKLLGKAGVPAGPVLSYPEVFDDPQIRHNDMYREIAEADGRVIPTIGLPVHYSGAGTELRLAPPRLGQHTVELLEAAEFSEAEIKAAIAVGVVALEGDPESLTSSL